MTKPYAWIIDKDHVNDGRDQGRIGPDNASPHYRKPLEMLPDGKGGAEFRLLDAGGKVRYEGRMLLHEDIYGMVDHAPLDEFGMARGCTEIEYRVITGKYLKF